MIHIIPKILRISAVVTIRQANFPFVLQPDNIAYARKSLIVHIRVAGIEIV